MVLFLLWYNGDMANNLIIIRGNAGSGKSIIAKALQKKSDKKVMIIAQDMVLRRILLGRSINPELNEKYRPHVIDLMELLASYGLKNGFDVVVEGVFKNKHGFQKVLLPMIEKFPHAHVYYLDVPLEETIRRHNARSKSKMFGEEKLREWYQDKEVALLGVPNEKTIPHTMSADEIVDLIFNNLND
jgi:chloramphenicol 3-O-phosphotransferase